MTFIIYIGFNGLISIFLFCSTALTSAGWVRMSIKPQHCPPSKQCNGHWISANFPKLLHREKISGAENQTQGCRVRSKYAIHCAMKESSWSVDLGVKTIWKGEDNANGSKRRFSFLWTGKFLYTIVFVRDAALTAAQHCHQDVCTLNVHPFCRKIGSVKLLTSGF